MAPVTMAHVQRAELALARLGDAAGSILALAGPGRAGDDLVRAVRSGSTWDDPFDALVALARDGQEHGYRAFSASNAASSVLGRLAREVPDQPAAASAAEHARLGAGAIERWVYDGAPKGIAGLELASGRHLREAEHAARGLRDALRGALGG